MLNAHSRVYFTVGYETKELGQKASKFAAKIAVQFLS